jgi:hypothetical protein
MRKVTEVFDRYRECARHVRNTYFSTIQSKDWDTVENFEAVAQSLFERIVIYQFRIGFFQCEPREYTRDFFRIVPTVADGIPVMISREKDRTGAWDHPIKTLTPTDCEIAFIKYFDWDDHGTIDFRYYWGEVLSSQKYPEIVGHALLIETQYADSYCVDSVA